MGAKAPRKITEEEEPMKAMTYLAIAPALPNRRSETFVLGRATATAYVWKEGVACCRRSRGVCLVYCSDRVTQLRTYDGDRPSLSLEQWRRVAIQRWTCNEKAMPVTHVVNCLRCPTHHLLYPYLMEDDWKYRAVEGC